MFKSINEDIFEKHGKTNPFVQPCEDCMHDIWSIIISEDKQNIVPKTYIFIEKIKDDELAE